MGTGNQKTFVVGTELLGLLEPNDIQKVGLTESSNDYKYRD